MDKSRRARATGSDRRSARDDRGVVITEYALLIAIALAFGVVMVSLGVAIAQDFGRARSYVLYPVP